MFVTGLAWQDEEILRGYELGACDFLMKPIRAEVLRAKATVFIQLQERTIELHDKAQDYVLRGDLTAAFREHCRAMHLLIRTFNQQRHKEETFQPVWDKHLAD